MFDDSGGESVAPPLLCRILTIYALHFAVEAMAQSKLLEFSHVQTGGSETTDVSMFTRFSIVFL